MTKRTTKRDSRALFGAKFTEQYDKWKNAEKGRGQDSFVKLIDSTLTRQSVNKWGRGENIPNPERLKKICDIFGVPEDYFDTDNMTHDQKYQYSSVYMTKLGQRHVKFSNMIGIDLDLIRSLTRLVDFDTLFPLYSPIEHTSVDPDTGEVVYDREVNFSQSAPMKDEDIDEDLRFLQIEQHGKRITLHRCDLAFLKEVQDKVIDYVEYLFYHRSKQMDEETKKFNQDRLEVTIDGKTVSGSVKDDILKRYKNDEHDTSEEVHPLTREDIEAFKKWRDDYLNSKHTGQNICIAHKAVTPEFVREHDRFAHYAYVFPDRPEEDWVSIYKEEPRPATQEDWEDFFEGKLIKGTHTRKNDQGVVYVVKEGK